MGIGAGSAAVPKPPNSSQGVALVAHAPSPLPLIPPSRPSTPPHALFIPPIPPAPPIPPPIPPAAPIPPPMPPAAPMLPLGCIGVVEEREGNDDMEEERDVSDDMDAMAGRPAGETAGCMPDVAELAAPVNPPKSSVG
eukprot:scaffold22350_cov124-Isochrysis_galbana.AAC.10